MAKTIETFMDVENEALIYDGKKLEDWHRTIGKLKLEGQKSLADGDDKSPIPFRYLNSGEVNVIQEICPSSEGVEKYDKTAIPIEVLALIALAQNENYFTAMYVWYNEFNSDPFVIGTKETGSYQNNYYAIACWGLEKKFSWETLHKQAHKSYVERRKASLKESKSQIDADLKNLDTLATKHFRGEWVSENYKG